MSKYPRKRSFGPAFATSCDIGRGRIKRSKYDEENMQDVDTQSNCCNIYQRCQQMIDFSDAESDSGYDVEDHTYSFPTRAPREIGISKCRSVNDFLRLKAIGEGAHGVVFKAMDSKSKETVALKRLQMESKNEGFPIHSLREIRCLLHLRHKNVIWLKDVALNEAGNKLYLVLDYAVSDLNQVMKKGQLPLTLCEIKSLMMDLFSGVSHLHENWIIHRDLKPSNLLIMEDGTLKIGDFSLARTYGSPVGQYSPLVVTLWYRSPELVLNAPKYSTPVDVWSAGCIFAELLRGAPLFPGRSEINQIQQIFKVLGTHTDAIWPGCSNLPVLKNCMRCGEYRFNQLFARFKTYLSSHGCNLLNRLLTYDPSKRITAQAALCHEYFSTGPSATGLYKFRLQFKGLCSLKVQYMDVDGDTGKLKF